MTKGWLVTRSGKPRARGAAVVCATVGTGGVEYSRTERSDPARSFPELLGEDAVSALGFS